MVTPTHNLQSCEKVFSLCPLWSVVVSMDAIFVQPLSCGIIYFGFTWGKWGCSSWDVFWVHLWPPGESLMCLGEIVVGHSVVNNGSHCGSLESQSISTDFVALSRLVDFNDICFWISLERGIMCCCLSSSSCFTLPGRFSLSDVWIQQSWQ